MGQRPLITVTGADGQLGKELRDLSGQFPGFGFIFLSRKELPIDDNNAVDRFLEKIRPDWLINCAAYTAVDKAESEEELAFLVNATGVRNLATACNNSGSKFIHLSTDYVFNGNAHVPYREDSTTDPQSVYGLSKLAGEQLATRYHPTTIILRTSWVYSVYGNNFVKTMLRLFREKKQISVVLDQLGSPTHAADLAEAIMHIISSGKWVPGVLHYSNAGEISWYDFAVAIKEITGSDCQVDPIPGTAYPTAAKRPAYSVLDKSKIQQVYGINLKDWKDSLKECLSKTGEY
jgi:dTDP-4-dehydrorhamnose reductase